MINKQGKQVSTKPYQTAAWKKKRKEILSAHTGGCQWCGRNDTPLTIHHTTRKYGIDNFDEYTNLSDGKFVVICKRCHFAKHRGLSLCQECLKNGEYNYKSEKYDTCMKHSGECDTCPKCGGMKSKKRSQCSRCGDIPRVFQLPGLNELTRALDDEHSKNI